MRESESSLGTAINRLRDLETYKRTRSHRTSGVRSPAGRTGLVALYDRVVGMG